MFDFRKFFNFKYLFAVDPGPLSSIFLKFLIIIFSIFLFLSLIFRFLIYFKKKDLILINFFKKLNYFFLTLAILGFILLFFRQEGIPFLSRRFWLLILLISSLFWLFFIFRFVFKIPQEKKKLKEKEIFEKYLPR